MVTVGGQQALDLVARLFLDPGDVVLAEGPTYVGALGVFQAAQAQVVHVPMDDDGLIPAALEAAIADVARAGRRAKFLYTIPTYQNPAGVTLTEERREQVLDICERAGLLVVEDDPYGQLASRARPRRRCGPAAATGVFYLSTFSKTFAPGPAGRLDPGAARGPRQAGHRQRGADPLPERVRPGRGHAVPRAPCRGASSSRSYREIYRERRDALLDALADLMPAGTTWTRPAGGLFVWATLPDGLDSKAMMPRAIAARVAYVPGTGFYADGTGTGSTCGSTSRSRRRSGSGRACAGWPG